MILLPPERKARLQKMLNEGHPLGVRLRDQALTGGGLDPFGRNILMYALTGEPIYAETAWDRDWPGDGRFGLKAEAIEKWMKAFADGADNYDDILGGNGVRESFIRWAVGYEWLGSYLSAADKQLYADFLVKLCTEIISGGYYRPNVMHIDYSLGVYFGMGIVDKLIGTHYLDGEYFDGDKGLQDVGGLTSTGADWTTMRNAMRMYREVIAAGGQWGESSQYNLGTLCLYATGVEALGVEHFPEYKPEEIGLCVLNEVTPDMEDDFIWGDMQASEGMILHKRIDAQMSYSVTPSLREFAAALFTLHAADTENWPASFAGYLGYDPYAVHEDWRV